MIPKQLIEEMEGRSDEIEGDSEDGSSPENKHMKSILDRKWPLKALTILIALCVIAALVSLWRKPPQKLSGEEIGRLESLKTCGSSRFRKPTKELASKWKDAQFGLGGPPVTMAAKCRITIRVGETTRSLIHNCRTGNVFLIGESKYQAYGFCSRPSISQETTVHYKMQNPDILSENIRHDFLRESCQRWRE